MRRDAALLAAAECGADPVLRLFGFAPAGITLGLNQDAARELDLERCARDGVPWASRPTGGRAIFHAQEWTYALAAPLDHPDWGGSLEQVYRKTGALLVASLNRLGVPATWAAGPPAPDLGPRARGAAAAPCFASTARHEVELGGRKLVGSAQRRTQRGVLQQGSLLLGEGHLRLADYLAVPEERRDMIRASLQQATALAAAWLGASASLGHWADALAAELRPGVRRLEGEAGAFLLTLSEAGSYTRPAV
jgi:lipoate-protein ligase A